MPKYVAFLRAINVGGHVVKMDYLRELFTGVGLAKVETFIASGNVIFDSKARNGAVLEKKIEGHLEQSLGYAVTTFLRTTAELAAVANYNPFTDTEVSAAGNTLFVAFVRSGPSVEVKKKLLSLASKVDDFHINDREVYWLYRRSAGESKFYGPLLEKSLGMQATVRNMTTVRKIVAKYC